MDNIIYTTPEQQIEKLKNQNLIIENEEIAKASLGLYGYSNLIKSYREPYVITQNGKKIYRTGVTFNQLRSLYLLDKNLRNAVMATMLDLEEHIKETAADVVSCAFGTHPNDYLKYQNYANKRKSKQRFTLSGILTTMNDSLATDKDPIHHYQQVHGIVPPWILFKSIYFTTINNFIDQFKAPQKDAMVKKLYDFPTLNISEEAGRILMMDTLFICQEYRNIAAHGGRTYNYECKYALRANQIFSNSASYTYTGFSQLLYLLNLLNYQAPYNYLNTVLSREVNRHCQKYPQDVTYLAQILNINIETHEFVWISEKSDKYHLNPHCSGMYNAIQIDIEEAHAHGLVPCRRCCQTN